VRLHAPRSVIWIAQEIISDVKRRLNSIRSAAGAGCGLALRRTAVRSGSRRENVIGGGRDLGGATTGQGSRAVGWRFRTAPPIPPPLPRAINHPVTKA
jgi:hypothetical protein